MIDFKMLDQSENDVRADSVAIIRLFRQTTMVTNDNYVRLDRSALDCPSLDLIEQFLLDGMNSLISTISDVGKISVSPQFYINQSSSGGRDEADLFTSIVVKGSNVNDEIVMKLRCSVSILVETVVGNRNVFNDNKDGVLENSEVDYLNNYARQFLAKNGCKKMKDNLCVHVGFDDTIGIQISDKLAPSDAVISNNDQELGGVAFVDGYILSKNIIYLVDATGKKCGSKAFICDYPEILQKVRQNPFSSKVAYTGYQRIDGTNKSTLHIRSIDVSYDEVQSVDEFRLSQS